MNKKILLVAAVALLVGGISGYAFVGVYNPSSTKPHNEHHNTTDHASHGAHMMSGNDHQHMSVETEREFIEHMIPHHQEAIDTAEEVLARGGSTPEMRSLAETIIAAQSAEITDMKAWYETWYEIPYTDTGSYVPMMRDLTRLSGAALDRVFLEDMIQHHMGAVMMARSVLSVAEHTEIRVLSETIISTQMDEIMLMRSLLNTI